MSGSVFEFVLRLPFSPLLKGNQTDIPCVLEAFALLPLFFKLGKHSQTDPLMLKNCNESLRDGLGIGVLVGCFIRKIGGPGLPGDLLIYQGHLLPLKGHLWDLVEAFFPARTAMVHSSDRWPTT